jgi:hypothetical protein
MARANDEPSHRAAVDAWLERSIDHASTTEIVRLFRGALEAVWSCAATTLGVVTLTAIAERALITSAGQFGFLTGINPRPNGDPRWKQQLQERLSSVPRAELIEGLRFGLIELVTVIGRLTAEILTDELHAAIGAVTVGPAEATHATDPPDPPTQSPNKVHV